MVSYYINAWLATWEFMIRYYIVDTLFMIFCQCAVYVAGFCAAYSMFRDKETVFYRATCNHLIRSYGQYQAKVDQMLATVTEANHLWELKCHHLEKLLQAKEDGGDLNNNYQVFTP